jgi:uncharacterized protein YbgA (DUF1722 family)
LKESQTRNGEFIAEEYNGAGDSDVKAESLRVQKILYEPRNKGDNTPVVLIHVTIYFTIILIRQFLNFSCQLVGPA